MLDQLASYHLTTFQWFLAALCTIITGMSKAGLNAISIITVSILAWIFGGKTSTGILLPMLIVSDIMAISYYKKQVHWQSLKKMWHWVALGILIGVLVGKSLDAIVFKRLMACLILMVVFSLFWFENRPLKNVSKAVGFAAATGIATGFATMIGNQAGGFATVYLMSMQLSKNYFIGTNAWLFLCVNIFKLPFHIFVWETIHYNSLAINILLFPFLLIGFTLGIYIVKRIDEKRYRKVVLWLTALASLFVFF
jgi:uncharacterized membrane protein YfcA